jgi:hypothetical protein
MHVAVGVMAPVPAATVERADQSIMVRLRLPAQSWWHVAVVGEALGEVARPTPGAPGV